MLITPTSFHAAALAPAAAGTAPATAAATPVAPVAHPAAAQADASAAVAKVAQTQAASAAVAALNKRLEPMGTSVRFELDSSTGKTVITMLDTENNKVVRQFPSEDTLAMIRALDQQQGLVINTKS